jgi:hypothetical protein
MPAEARLPWATSPPPRYMRTICASHARATWCHSPTRTASWSQLALLASGLDWITSPAIVAVTEGTGQRCAQHIFKDAVRAAGRAELETLDDRRRPNLGRFVLRAIENGPSVHLRVRWQVGVDRNVCIDRSLVAATATAYQADQQTQRRKSDRHRDRLLGRHHDREAGAEESPQLESFVRGC